MSNFRPIDRQTSFLLPPSVDDWLPEKHLARFIVELIDNLDVSAMSGAYRGSGSASYHPRLLLGILVYGYATGVFSSRKLERATYDSVAFRFIAANDHPDHDTIAMSERLSLTINVRFPAAFSEGDRGAVRSASAPGARDGSVEDGDGGVGRHEDPCQCQQAQCAFLRACRQGLSPRRRGSRRN